MTVACRRRKTIAQLRDMYVEAVVLVSVVAYVSARVISP